MGDGSTTYRETPDLNIQPISFEEACNFVDEHHSTHDAPSYWKFGCAVNKNGDEIVGVVMVSRPVSRHYCDGWTLEVTRCCTDGTHNAASKLYAAAWRAARALGYKRLITYTITETEDGTPLNAAGWEVVHETAGGGSWDRPSRPRHTTSPTGQKTLWEVNGSNPSECNDEQISTTAATTDTTQSTEKTDELYWGYPPPSNPVDIAHIYREDGVSLCGDYWYGSLIHTEPVKQGDVWHGDDHCELCCQRTDLVVERAGNVSMGDAQS